MKRFISLVLITAMLLSCMWLFGCSAPKTEGESFNVGFASIPLEYGDMSEYYIAGYRGGRNPRGVLDPQQIKALWIDNGNTSALLITVDCVGLDGGTVSEIRASLASFIRESGCDSVNIISTHTHAGVDTLGLWGPVGINGKNQSFIDQIVALSEGVARAAYSDRRAGGLYYSATETEGLQEDSRDPQVYDNRIYQLRFSPDDGSAGTRLVSFAAHAEALRGGNLMISADFPAELSELVFEATGDRLMFAAGAIGGLIKTPELSSNALNSMEKTADGLAAYVLAPAEERQLSPVLRAESVKFKTKLENTLFIYYKFLGILGNNVSRGLFGGYYLQTELSLLRVGDVTFALFPGEVFPELIYGSGGLAELAAEQGFESLVPVGLANDEIGYIIPEDDFVLSEEAPYVKEAEGHYEETNSVGPECASDLRDAFEKCIKMLKK